MAFCAAHGIDNAFGLPTNAVLRADPPIVEDADACAVKRAEDNQIVLHTYVETRYHARS
jgi:hypothetical protein